jgi:hypothetical protein
MNVQERLGRRKEEARAGLEAARGRGGEFTVRLAALIAGLARGGADKLTLLPSKSLEQVGPVVQTLLDRVVVVVGEPNGKKSDYEIDRFFVSMALSGEPHDMTYLAEAGHPVVQWTLEPAEIDGEIQRWRSVKAVLDQLLPPPAPVDGVPMPAEPSLVAGGLVLYAPPDHARVLRAAAGTLGQQAASSPAGWVAAQIALADPGDHVALAAWLPRGVERDLSDLQAAIRNPTRLACTRSFDCVRPDPRGIFLVLTSGDPVVPDLPAGRALRIDGDPARIIESLRDATRMLSRR